MIVYGIKQKRKWPLPVTDIYANVFQRKAHAFLGPTVIEKVKLGARLKEFYCIYNTHN
jgi:hypothetical protein